MYAGVQGEELGDTRGAKGRPLSTARVDPRAEESWCGAYSRGLPLALRDWGTPRAEITGKVTLRKSAGDWRDSERHRFGRSPQHPSPIKMRKGQVATVTEVAAHNNEGSAKGPRLDLATREPVGFGLRPRLLAGERDAEDPGADLKGFFQ